MVPHGPIHIDATTVFWSGLNARDSAAINHLAAAAFPVSRLTHILAGDDVVIEGQPLIWQDERRRAAWVNGRFFSDLAICDATSLTGETVIGVAQPALLRAWPAARVIRYLLRAGIIRTFIHMEATLNVMHVHEDDGVYRECYDAVHVYYTNEENRVAYRFGVTLSRRNGSITLAAGQNAV